MIRRAEYMSYSGVIISGGSLYFMNSLYEMELNTSRNFQLCLYPGLILVKFHNSLYLMETKDYEEFSGLDETAKELYLEIIEEE